MKWPSMKLAMPLGECTLGPGMVVKTGDISRTLSRVCRFNGYVCQHYSVLQHMLFCYHLALEVYGNGKLANYMLVHDAAEAYTGDIITPVKSMLGDEFADMEALIEDQVIGQHFGIELPDHDVKHAKAIDWMATQAEAHYMVSYPLPWAQKSKVAVQVIQQQGIIMSDPAKVGEVVERYETSLQIAFGDDILAKETVWSSP